MASPTSLSVCFVLLLLVVSAVGDSRLQELLALRARSSDGVIRLDDNSFKKYGQGDDRPYALFLFFDARDLREQNPDLNLADLRLEFAFAAQASNPKDAKFSESDKIFFVDIEFRQSQNTFRAFKVEALPHLRLIPGSNEKKSEEMRPDQFPRTAEGMASFVTQKVGIEMGPIVRPPFLSTFQIFVICAMFLGIAPFAAKYLLTQKTIFHDPRAWCLLGLSIYFFSISGGMYNIIRGMPMYSRDRENPHKYNYWYSGSGAQFGVEGFSVGTLYYVVGILLAFTTFFVPKISNKNFQRLIVYGCIVACVTAARQVVKLDQWKTGYRIHAFFPKSWR